MKNKELIHFLNSGVKVYHKEYKSYYPLVIENTSVSALGGYNVDECGRYGHIPLLYPPTVLTETINHEGKDEIPLVELAKIEGTYKGEEYYIEENGAMSWTNKKGTYCQFYYKVIDNCFCFCNNAFGNHCYNQLALFQYLFSRRINVFGIEAIDPRTLGDKNPYLITNRKIEDYELDKPK